MSESVRQTTALRPPATPLVAVDPLAGTRDPWGGRFDRTLGPAGPIST